VLAQVALTAPSPTAAEPGRPSPGSIQNSLRASRVGTEALRLSSPGELRVTPLSETALVIAWTASEGDTRASSYVVGRGDEILTTTHGTQAIDGGLRPGVEYCYTVRAHGPAGQASDAVGPVCAKTPDLTPPGNPGTAAGSAVSEHEIRLSWTAATDNVGVVGYEVVRDGKVVAGTPGTSIVIPRLAAGTEYCFQIRALDAASLHSELTPPACVTTLDITPPSTPDYVVARVTREHHVELAWRAARDNVGVAEYEVWRAGERITTSTTTMAEDVSVAAGAKICYAIVAVDEARNRSSPSREVCVTPPDVTPPTPPEGVVALATSPTAIALAWEESSDDVGVVGYEVLRNGEVVARVRGTQSLQVGLTGEQRHCFRVRAIDAAGNRSDPSWVACGQTSPAGVLPAPWGLTAKATSSSAIKLSWFPSEVPGAIYRVYWDGGKTIGATRQTSFIAAGMRAGESHCYKVAAVDKGGRESPRIEACATTTNTALSAR
jgi:chitodextrinase